MIGKVSGIMCRFNYCYSNFELIKLVKSELHLPKSLFKVGRYVSYSLNHGSARDRDRVPENFQSPGSSLGIF